MNKAIIVGYLTADPIYKNQISEKEFKMARFSVAVNDMTNFSQTYFFNCVAWNQTAEYIGNNLKKGDFVSIDGKLVTRSFINKEGKKSTTTEIVVISIKNIGSRKAKSENEKSINSQSEEKNSLNDIFETNSSSEENHSNVSNIEEEEYNLIDWEEELK